MRLTAFAPLAALILSGAGAAQPPGYGGYGSDEGRYGNADPAYAGGYGGQPGYMDADGPYGQAGPGYRSGWSDQRPIPAYRDDERWSGGDFYGTAEARDDDDLDLQAARTRRAVAPSRYADERSLTAALNAREAERSSGPRAVHRSVGASPYAERIARWRARADACEAGNVAACRDRDD